MNFFTYVTQNSGQILALLGDHIKLTAVSVGLAILIGVPLGILISYVSKISRPVLAVANVVQAIPSMALLGFMIPLVGIGVVPAVVAVILYSLLPIIKNTYTGIDNIDPQTLEAAKGIGLTPVQVLMKVQIPLALPVIMAGVRIAAVTAVGLMTMAAFIGAGGLGYLVFSGIRTVNNNQILAGAIPACLLALAVDFLVGLIEKLVTPISLQKGDNVVKKKHRNRQKALLGASALVLAAVFIITSAGKGVQAERTIAIGSKDFTEQGIVGNMVAEFIEARTDIQVERRLELGGTQVCFAAMQTGDIDMYIDYTGTVYADTLRHTPISDIEEVYATAKTELAQQYDIVILDQMSFNNTYTLAVTRDTAAKYGLESMSDLARVAGQLRSGTTFEFSNREDGLPGLQKTYGFTMGKSLTVDGAARYSAITNDEVDVIDAFATDGLLKKFDLLTLVDDKQFFPPYYAIPLIRADTLEKCPEIAALMTELGSRLTDEVMTELNYRVDELQESPVNVAHDFLQSQGLLS